MDRKWLTSDELETDLQTAKDRGVRDECLIYLSYKHGLRREEASILKWVSVDLNLATIYVERVKGSNSCTHPLESNEIKLLRKLKRQNNTPFLFSSLKGGAITPNRISCIARDIAKKTGITHFHHHSLRHTCGYNMAEKGINPLIIKNWLGHKNLQNTMIYVEGACQQFNNLPKW